MDSNITYRKTFTNTTGSVDDLSVLTNEDERTILDTTMLSIPDSLHDATIDNDIVNELKDEIKLLTSQLMSAHKEIENLHSENFRLKSDLQKSLKNIETYKKICTTPQRRSKTPTSARKNPKPLKTPPMAINKDSSARSNPQVKPKVDMHNKQTQTHIPTIDTLLQVNQKAQKKSHQSNFTPNKSSGVLITPIQKNKMCIISSDCTRGTLPLIEETFSGHFEFCHYLLPNCTTKVLICNIENKLKDFTMKDYCLIFIGKHDLNNDNYMDLLDNLQSSLKNATHTNNIICCPMYIKGAMIHNYKVELFNNLLYLDLKNKEYAYFFDSNKTLTHDMFSYNTGKINKSGWRHIYNQIMTNILIDYDLFYSQDALHDELNQRLPSENEITTPSTSGNEFFLL